MENKVPFIIATKRKKITRNKLNKRGENLYTENYKTLLKKIESDIKKWEGILRS